MSFPVARTRMTRWWLYLSKHNHHQSDKSDHCSKSPRAYPRIVLAEYKGIYHCRKLTQMTWCKVKKLANLGITLIMTIEMLVGSPAHLYVSIIVTWSWWDKGVLEKLMSTHLKLSIIWLHQSMIRIEVDKKWQRCYAKKS